MSDGSTLTIRRCNVVEIASAQNIAHIVEEYAAESSIRGLPAPIAKLETYAHLEAAGALYVIGAFLNNLLIGFISVLSPVLPHYSRTVSVAESYFVLAEYRKTGAGLKLLHAAEDRAREVGSPGLLVSAPWGGVLANVLPHVGYEPSNQVFFKAFADV
jgi:GNAT superfamily N-acetyltransferase